MSRKQPYACAECGYHTAKWLGRCPECGSWDTLAEVAHESATARDPAATAARVRPFPEIDVRDAQRMSTGLGELDRVLGGGLVPGAVVLLGGEPGVGKSTLLLQAAQCVAGGGRRVLYASGEESAAQLRARGERLGVRSADLLVAADTTVESLLEATLEHRPALLVVDSIQAVRCAGLPQVAGSISQVRESAARFVHLAKTLGLPVVLVGHVTKDGALAGPRALEHVVDTVVQFEGDRHHEHRVLRALKNRFGPTDELGVFRMTETGLVEVANPSELLLAERQEDVPGSAVLAAVQGTRPLLVEVQALVGPEAQGSARRTALGLDPQRLAMILAVLERHAALPLAQREVYANVTGGLSVLEPAADLAVAAAIASSARQRPLPRQAMIAGELGLAGEVRAISRIEARLRESARLGFESAHIPQRSAPASPPRGLTLVPASRLTDALEALFRS